MKQVFNYCCIPEYEEEIKKSGKDLNMFINTLDLDGVELNVYRSNPYLQSFESEAIGAHLRFWPAWLDFWRENDERLNKIYKSQKEIDEYYGGTTKAAWLLQIKRNIEAALLENPEYLVMHVSDASDEEIFSFDFAHTDLEVVRAAASVFNRVAHKIPENVTVLFENLWWPGLRLTDQKIVAKFFQLVKRENVGIMLDTGHLMNTNPDLKTEEEAIDYVCETIRNLGDYAKYIKGIHLSCSLTGAYVKKLSKNPPKNVDIHAKLTHISKIDEHKPFTSSKVNEIIDLVKPKYLVHELAYKDFKDLEKNIKTQLSVLKR